MLADREAAKGYMLLHNIKAGLGEAKWKLTWIYFTVASSSPCRLSEWTLWRIVLAYIGYDVVSNPFRVVIVLLVYYRF
jgi:hypothetical protein